MGVPFALCDFMCGGNYGFLSPSVDAAATTNADCDVSDEDYDQLRVRLSHTVLSERTEPDIVEWTRKTLTKRRIWIKDDAPTAAEILKQFPRFMDTPSLV